MLRNRGKIAEPIRQIHEYKNNQKCTRAQPRTRTHAHEHADGSQVAAAYPVRSWRKKSNAWLKINLNATSINSDRCNGCAASRATNNWAAEVRLKFTLKKMRQAAFPIQVQLRLRLAITHFSFVMKTICLNHASTRRRDPTSYGRKRPKQTKTSTRMPIFTRLMKNAATPT